MGHRDVKTTLTVYAHLINTDDHTSNMAALGALCRCPARTVYGAAPPCPAASAMSRHWVSSISSALFDIP